jgi:glutaredoxin
MAHATLLTVKGCSLCKAAVVLARRLQPELRYGLVEQDISENPELRARYGLQVPVLLVDGTEVGWGELTEEMFRRTLEPEKARWRKSISRILFRFGRPKR